MNAANAIERTGRREDGLWGDVPEDQYHSDRLSLSVSGAKLLLPPSCPEKFRHNQDHPRKPKKVWDFGHVAHRLILGKGVEIAVLDPKVHGLTKKGDVSASPTSTGMWQSAVEEARQAGQTPIHIDDYRLAEAMAEKVLTDPEAGPIFAEGVAEQSFYYTDPETDVQLRGRTDWLADGEIDDVKTSTTANPAELERKFWTLGYFMQAAWYRDLVIALGIHPNPRFRFIVVEKEPPHVVTVVEYDDEALREGRRLNRQAITTYLRCRESGQWPGYVEGTATLSLPRWALHDGIQADANELITELEGLYT